MNPYAHIPAGSYPPPIAFILKLLFHLLLPVCLILLPNGCTPQRIIHPIGGETEAADPDPHPPPQEDSAELQILYFAWADNGDYQAVLSDLDELHSSAHISDSRPDLPPEVYPGVDLRVAYACGERSGHDSLPPGLHILAEGVWRRAEFAGWNQAVSPGDALAAALDWCEMFRDAGEGLQLLIVAGESGHPYRGVLYDQSTGSYLTLPDFADILAERGREIDLICFDSGFSSSIELSYEVYGSWLGTGVSPPAILGMSGQFPLAGRDYTEVMELIHSMLESSPGGGHTEPERQYARQVSDAGQGAEPDAEPHTESENGLLSGTAGCLDAGLDYSLLLPENGSVLLLPSAWEGLLPVMNEVCSEITSRLSDTDTRDEYRLELMESSMWYTTPGDLRISPRSLLGETGSGLFIPVNATERQRMEGRAGFESLKSALEEELAALVHRAYPAEAADPVHMLLVSLFSNGEADPRFPLEYSGEEMGYCSGRLGFCRDSFWAPGCTPSLLDRLWFDLIE
ncbi:hypothetical protein [Salinispira pacifica]|uniref:Uncharacterized protein n=1 Tax=Salinispira pacifica TaxID=1307761 RepID=V5WK58_9SPIO|nr:hypothetical protein [Salinispira pacifica]AHC15974.1 hypothetical protein L21SP2_2622 [Salinispira pacifica]